MPSFQEPGLTRLPLTHALFQTIGALGGCKGRQELFQQQSPQTLETLLKAAIIESTESSNRIEGVTAPPQRIKKLVADKTTPQNRSEQEILGYRNVLATIHASAADMPFTPSLVQQLHRDLFQFTAQPGGAWKSADNDITETRPDGTKHVRFHPVAAFQVPIAMDSLHRGFNDQWQSGEIDRLLLIPAYVLDFLCIHPFRDGNGRMARLLTLLLLYQAGYEVGRFISLERIIEQNKESYYDTLYASSQDWHENAHTLLPWTEYSLGILLRAYRQFEERVGTLNNAHGNKTQLVRDAVARLPDRFRMADVERLCPSVSRDMIRVVLRRMKPEGVHSEGVGSAAIWRNPATLSIDLRTKREL